MQFEFESLEGLFPAARTAVYEHMRQRANWERLTVCLFFMSGLSLEMQHLSDIENELREIFPPSTRSKLLPDEYQDFQASAIRFYFNAETRAVRNGDTAESERLWENPKRGYWRNTTRGNDDALGILKECGITIRRRGEELSPRPGLPRVARPYLEEPNARPMAAAVSEGSPPEGTWLTGLLESLPAPAFTSTIKPTSAVAVEGNVPAVCHTLRRLLPEEVLHSVRITLEAEAAKSLWKVRVEVNHHV